MLCKRIVFTQSRVESEEEDIYSGRTIRKVTSTLPVAAPNKRVYSVDEPIATESQTTKGIISGDEDVRVLGEAEIVDEEMKTWEII